MNRGTTPVLGLLTIMILGGMLLNCGCRGTSMGSMAAVSSASDQSASAAFVESSDPIGGYEPYPTASEQPIVAPTSQPTWEGGPLRTRGDRFASQNSYQATASDVIPVAAEEDLGPVDPIGSAAGYQMIPTTAQVMPPYAQYVPTGPGMEQGIPMPMPTVGPWRPPFSGDKPWPEDEYLRDGGDEGGPAGVVQGEWQVNGLDMEDCIAHYDTVDGRRLTEPSNKVYIYSPRFGAVRQVSGVRANDDFEQAIAFNQTEKPFAPQETQYWAASKQNIELQRQIDSQPSLTEQASSFAGVMSEQTKAIGFTQDLLPYENHKWVTSGQVDASAIPWLAKQSQAAITWSGDQMVQVVLDNQGAMEEVSDQKLQDIYTVKSPEGEVKLKVQKIASTDSAQPGEEVSFTIRFDNVGTQVIGNVTIIDSLSTRLEYVEDSGKCSLPADFFTSVNEGDSLVIRCEVINPLEPGEGGIVRFKCKVR